MLRLAFDFIITWRETRTRPNAYLYYIQCFGHNPCCDFCKLGSFSAKENIYIDVCYSAFRLFTGLVRALR